MDLPYILCPAHVYPHCQVDGVWELLGSRLSRSGIKTSVLQSGCCLYYIWSLLHPVLLAIFWYHMELTELAVMMGILAISHFINILYSVVAARHVGSMKTLFEVIGLKKAGGSFPQSSNGDRCVTHYSHSTLCYNG